MSWRKVEIGELLLLEKGHEMQQIIGVGRQRVGRTSPRTQVPQETRNNGNGLAVVIEQFKGSLVVVALLNALDSHRWFSPFNTGRLHSEKRVMCVGVGGKPMRKEERGQKCLHNSETAFARRFQAMLRSAWHNRSWHVIVADPGAGKTTSIRDLQKRAGGRSILAVVTPKNNDDEQALGDQFFAALGVPIRGHWSTRKPKLMGHLHQSRTECLVVDDAHDLSMPHLMFLKEVTDQGRLQHDHPLGLCLVAAGRG